MFSCSPIQLLSHHASHHGNRACGDWMPCWRRRYCFIFRAAEDWDALNVGMSMMSSHIFGNKKQHMFIYVQNCSCKLCIHICIYNTQYVQLVLEFKKVDFAKYLILVVGLLLSKPKGEEGPKLRDFAIGYTWIYQVFSGPVLVTLTRVCSNIVSLLASKSTTFVNLLVMWKNREEWIKVFSDVWMHSLWTFGSNLSAPLFWKINGIASPQLHMSVLVGIYSVSSYSYGL